MTNPRPDQPGARRDRGAVRDGRRKRPPLWLLLLLGLLLLALIAGILFAIFSGGSSTSSSVAPATPISPTAGSPDTPTGPVTVPGAGATAATATATAPVSPGAGASEGATGSASPSATSTALAGGLVGGGAVVPAPASGPFAAGDTLGTVLFAEDSAALTANAKAVIARAVATIKAEMPAQIVVSGYTDQIANQPSNKTLSKKRADAVLAALKSGVGQSGTQFTERDHGESDPIASNATADGRQQNRRATITTD